MPLVRTVLLVACALSALAPNRALAFAVPSLPVVIDESFDDYADQAAFEAVWQPTAPINIPFPPPYGLLVPDAGFGLPFPNEFPPGLEGKGVFIQHGLNVYTGPAQQELESLEPVPGMAIKLSGDMFDDGLPNKRTTIGLRTTPGSNAPLSIIELGRFNGPSQDPFDPTFPPPNLPSTGFAYRILQLGFPSPPLVRQPNWQYFPLDPALDGPDEDTLVGPDDIGPGWHEYSAVIGLDFVQMTLDLFRDGLNNATNEPGVDSSVTWPIFPFPGLLFNRLQIGGPSGITSTFGSVVDNIRVEMVEAVIPEPSAAALALIGLLACSRRRRSSARPAKLQTRPARNDDRR